MPRVQNSSPQAVLKRIVNLTAADILALGTTPFELVPAPGPGMLIVVESGTVVYHFGTSAYETPNSDVLQWFYASDTTPGREVVFVAGTLSAAQSVVGYSSASTSVALALLPGVDNNPVVLTALDQHGGPIVTATLGAGGAAYVVNDTGTITTGNSDATYKVLTVDGGGAVLTFSITPPGTAYNVGNGQATAPGGAQPGVGAGFTVNITAVQNGDGTLKVTTFYSIIPVP